MTRRIRAVLEHRHDKGFSLIEMLVSMVVFGIAISMVYTVLIKVQAKTTGSQQSSDAVSQLRAALQDIDKQVRSGNVLYSPANETVPTSCTANAPLFSGTCMRIYTQTDFGVAASGRPDRCVQWQVLPDATAAGPYILRTRNWDPDWMTNHDVTLWRTVAVGMTVSGGTSGPNPLPFTLNSTSAFGQRLLDLKLEVTDKRDGKTVTLQSSLSGRNTTYGYDANLCTPVP
jgi:prepilin-type N-terminal cleavage/methylation domain-containing protein